MSNKRPDLTEATEQALEQLCYCDLRNSIGIDKARKIIREALYKFGRDRYRQGMGTLQGFKK